MPFQLQNVNVGSDLRLKAALDIAENIRKERERREQTEKDIAFSDTTMKAALEDGRISDAEYADYLQAPANKKYSVAVAQMANVAEDFKRAQYADRLLAERAGQEGWQPDPATLQRASELGFMYVPQSRRSGSWVNTRAVDVPEPGKAVYDDEGNQIGVYDAKGKITKLPTRKSDDNPYMDPDFKRKTDLASLDRQIAELQGEIAQGNQKSGPDWNPLATPNADKLRGLLAKRKALESGSAAAALSEQQLEGVTAQAPLPGPLPGKSPPPKAGGTPAPAPSATAPVINSEQDYASLPAGALYVDARDGTLKRKKAAAQ